MFAGPKTLFEHNDQIITYVTDIGFGSMRQTLRNSEHHLLDSLGQFHKWV